MKKKENQKGHDLPTGVTDFRICEDMFVQIEKAHCTISELAEVTGSSYGEICRLIQEKLSDEVDLTLSQITGLKNPETVSKLRIELNTAMTCYEAEKTLQEQFGMVAEARRALFGNPNSKKKEPGLLFLAKEFQRILSVVPQRGWEWIYDEEQLDVIRDVKFLLGAPTGEISPLVALLERADLHSQKTANTPPDAAKLELADRVVLALHSCGIEAKTTHKDYHRGEGISPNTRAPSQDDDVSIKLMRYVLKMSGESVDENARLDSYLSPAIDRLKNELLSIIT